jgi:hypothetical protein
MDELKHKSTSIPSFAHVNKLAAQVLKFLCSPLYTSVQAVKAMTLSDLSKDREGKSF